MALSLRESIVSARRLPRDAAVLAGRAELLAPEDRELVQAIVVNGQTATSVAAIAGLSARTVINRVKKLAARMASRTFLDAARAMPYLDQADAGLAALKFCSGLSDRKIAERTGLSAHAVRRRLDKIGAQIAMINRIRRAGGGTRKLQSPGAAKPGVPGLGTALAGIADLPWNVDQGLQGRRSPPRRRAK